MTGGRRWLIATLGVLATALCAVPGFVQPRETRVALVLGNAAYAPSGQLRNPVNDARDMADALRATGFDVILRTDANLRDMQRTIREFGERLRPDGVAMFYYAGHGVQVRGVNYLIPLGARIEREAEVEDEAVDVNRVLRVMEDSRSRVNIVFLDACRDNPFGRGFRGATRGLAVIPATSGSFIAYATSPGAVAADGTGRNGIFTGALLSAIKTPGLPIEIAFKHVVANVRQRTGGAQIPWMLSSLDRDFMFLPGAAPSSTRVATAPPPPPPAPPTLEGRELMRFGSIELSARIPGVDVWLGDRKVWTSKAGAAYVLSNVPAGSHRIVARKDGHKEWSREVQIGANQQTDVTIDIEPIAPAKVINTDDGAEMVLVPAGEFWMGSDQVEVDRAMQECKSTGNTDDTCRKWLDRELGRHRVVLDAYYLDRYEVTNRLFERFVRATGHSTSAERLGDASIYRDKKWEKVKGLSWRTPNGPGTSADPTHPVVNVSWVDADAYCRWAGKRLPTEAEWEKAARGTDGRRYPWGDQWDATRTNALNTLGKVTRVGAYPGGISPYGAHDMAGNAAEWTADWLDATYYPRSPERNPRGPNSGEWRAIRGGDWLNPAVLVRTTTRDFSLLPDERYNIVGFRCAKPAP